MLDEYENNIFCNARFNEEKRIGKIFKALNGFILPLNLKLDKVIFVNESLMNYIKDFNKKDTILVISDYPEHSKNGEKNYGIAWYTKTLIEPISKRYNTRFVVLAEKIQGDNRPKIYEDGKILVLRIFDQKHPSLFPIILRWLFKFNNVRYVQVHSEFHVNGGVKNFMLLLPFIGLIKATGRNITYFSHNVVTELDSIAKHLGLEKGSLKLKVFTFGLRSLYISLGLIVDKFVVMDEVIYDRLSLFVNRKKIVLNRFWLDKAPVKESLEESRKKIGVSKKEFVVLYFGFVSYYKGADWIIHAVRKLRQRKDFKNIRLIIAGGEAYSLKHEKYYQKFYKNLLNETSEDKRIKITGFVAEEDIPTYFQASDLVVFPYRGLIGGSGCFSHAIRYGKPFIISNKMSSMLKNSDIRKLMRKFDIKSQDVTFPFDIKMFGGKLKKAEDHSFRSNLARFSYELGEERNSENLIPKAYDSIFAIKDKKSILLNLRVVSSILFKRV